MSISVKPGKLLLVRLLSPCTPCISCSMGLVISDSISWGEAERQSTVMLR